MGVRKLKPTTPGQRFKVVNDFDVKKWLAPPKSIENYEKPQKNVKNVPIFF